MEIGSFAKPFFQLPKDAYNGGELCLGRMYLSLSPRSSQFHNEGTIDPKLMKKLTAVFLDAYIWAFEQCYNFTTQLSSHVKTEYCKLHVVEEVTG